MCGGLEATREVAWTQSGFLSRRLESLRRLAMADQDRHLWGAFCLGVVVVLELLSGRQDLHWWSWRVHTCPELQTHRLVSC